MRPFTGTLRLTWLAMKRDRIQLPVWVAGLGVLMFMFTATYDGIFDTAEELHTATVFFAGNPVTRMFALPSGDDLGSYTLLRSFTTFSVLTGLMSVLAVVRHTRQSEEARQAEVLASTVVGRYALLAAALIVVVLANGALALLVGIGFMLHGLATGSALVAGVSAGAAGVSFGAIAAVTAQVSSSSRGAAGMAAGAIGVAFVLAAVGSVLGTLRPSGVEVDPAWPTWLSPIGWAQLMRPFAEDNLWPLLIVTAFFAACTVLAFALIDRRDVGRGILKEGKGPASASRSLLSPLGLAWRLQRGVFFGWAAAVVGFGLVMGSIAGDIQEMLGELDAIELIERIGGTEEVTDAYFVMAIGALGSIVAAYTVQVLLRMRIEESDGPLESVLGTSVSRTAWMLSYVVNAGLGTLALLLLLGASTGVGAGLVFDDMRTWLPELTLAGLVQTPATLVLAGLAVLAFALLPRRAGGLTWGIFAVALLTGPVLGEMLNLPDSLLNVSPFGYTPNLPAGDLDIVAVAGLMAVALVLLLGGLEAFRRRDLAL